MGRGIIAQRPQLRPPEARCGRGDARGPWTRARAVRMETAAERRCGKEGGLRRRERKNYADVVSKEKRKATAAETAGYA